MKTKTYAFIDSQNLNLGVRPQGWKLDYKKLRRYLSDKYRVNKALLFIGYIKQSNKLYKKLGSYGFQLLFKPTVKDNQGKPKDDAHEKLVLHVDAILFNKYNKAVIVSGDDDFYCLHEFLVEADKLLPNIIPNEQFESSLLKHFQRYKILCI